MKTINCIAWISIGIGVLVILYGAVHILLGWAIYPIKNSEVFFQSASRRAFFVTLPLLYRQLPGPAPAPFAGE